MIYSGACQYAVRALIYLADQDIETPVLGRDIAKAEDIPKPFLTKILHILCARGLVRSVKGPGGGYMLAKPASRIKLIEVVEAVDGPMDLSKECVLGLDACSDHTPCALHEQWKQFREGFSNSIQGLTVETMTRTLASKRKPKTRKR